MAVSSRLAATLLYGALFLFGSAVVGDGTKVVSQAESLDHSEVFDPLAL